MLIRERLRHISDQNRARLGEMRMVFGYKKLMPHVNEVFHLALDHVQNEDWGMIFSLKQGGRERTRERRTC
jgi:hypothetical protein